MNQVWLYAIISVIIVSLISLIGLVTISVKIKKLKKIIIYFVSFAAGALFGGAFIHLLPEAIEETSSTLTIFLFVLIGIIFLFIIEKIVNWRHCHDLECKGHPSPFAYTNLVGDGIHNFIDGLIIGAAYLVNFQVGIATTIAVVLHEIPQEIGDFGVLIHAGFSKAKALWFNFLTALTAIIGAIVALSLSTHIENLTMFLIPFAAGSFIYIAGSDLIPELHKEVKVSKSIIQLIVFILGIAIIFSLLLLE